MPTSLGMTQREMFHDLMRQSAQYVSLHDGPPNELGEHEIMDEFYERQRVIWNGEDRNIEEIQFTIAPCRVAYIGFWDAKVGGTFAFGNTTKAETIMNVSYYHIAPRLLSLAVIEG